jgi:hypothetical protein
LQRLVQPHGQRGAKYTVVDRMAAIKCDESAHSLLVQVCEWEFGISESTWDMRFGKMKENSQIKRGLNSVPSISNADMCRNANIDSVRSSLGPLTFTVNRAA